MVQLLLSWQQCGKVIERSITKLNVKFYEHIWVTLKYKSSNIFAFETSNLFEWRWRLPDEWTEAHVSHTFACRSPWKLSKLMECRVITRCSCADRARRDNRATSAKPWMFQGLEGTTPRTGHCLPPASVKGRTTTRRDEATGIQNVLHKIINNFEVAARWCHIHLPAP